MRRSTWLRNAAFMRQRRIVSCTRQAASAVFCIDATVWFAHCLWTDMKMLFVADLHYALKQFDWLVANASNFDPIIIGGDLLDLGSALDFDVQIMVVEKYLRRIRQN